MSRSDTPLSTASREHHHATPPLEAWGSSQQTLVVGAPHFCGEPHVGFALRALVYAQATGQPWLLVDGYQALVGQWLATIGQQQSVAALKIFLLVDVELWITCESHASRHGNNHF